MLDRVPLITAVRHWLGARVPGGCCLAVLLLALASPARGFEVTDGWLHRHWTVKEGLPTNLTTGLVLGQDGYLWIATYDGLVRFDGVRFEAYRTRTTQGLPTNRLQQMAAGRDGSLWLRGASKELVRYRDETFQPVPLPDGVSLSSLNALAEGADGSVWLGTNRGLWRQRDGQLAPVSLGREPPLVLSVAVASDGAVWAGTEQDGLLRHQAGQTSVFGLCNGQLPRKLEVLRHDARGTLWIGSPTGLLAVGPKCIEAWPSQAVQGLTEIAFVLPDLGGQIWLGSDQGLLQLQDGVLRPLAIPGPVPTDLFRTPPPLRGLDGRLWHSTSRDVFVEGVKIFTSDSAITGMALDPEGSLWVGTHTDGLHQLRKAPLRILGKPEGLPDDIVYPILEDADGSLWIGTLYGGVAHLRDGVIRVFHREHGVPARFVWALGRTRDGEIWVGGSGICRMLQDRCTQEGVPPQLLRPTVRAIFEDSKRRLWIGTETGVHVREAGQWSRFAPEGRDLAHLSVRLVHEAPDGAIWMATAEAGLLIFRDGQLQDLTQREGLPSNRIRSLHQDASGSLWVGTEDSGLCRLRPDASAPSGFEIRGIDPSAGLFDDTIHQILDDGHDRLWMNTNRGIFWVLKSQMDDVADGRAPRIVSVSYTEQDGLRNREGNGGMQPAGIRARDGRLWFPSQQGAVVVEPARIEANRVPPPVHIQAIVTRERALKPHQPLQLSPTERDLEIHYTALSFIEPGKMRFRYRLLGLDEAWVEAGDRRTAYFTSVPPGDYRFEVRAANNDGLWNEQGASVALHFVPRFHETRLFAVLVVLGWILLGLGAARWRIRLLKARAARLEKQVSERTHQLEMEKTRTETALEQVAQQARSLAELSEFKTRLYTNLSHELRTPLTLILGPLRQMLEARSNPLDPSLHRSLETMLRSAEMLSRRVTEILDLQKLDAGKMQLRQHTLDLAGFLLGTVEAFQPLAQQRGLRLNLRTPDGNCLIDLDEEQMGKVLANLLSNALKFTPRGGLIEVELRLEPETVQISVADNGPGIEARDLPRLFERFFQASTARSGAWEGTGIGLALARELTELHGGTLTVQSTPGQGSTFTVRLPRVATQLPANPSDRLDPIATAPLSRGAAIPVAPRPDPLSNPQPSGPGLAAATPSDQPQDAAAATPENEAPPEIPTILIVEDHVDLRAYIREILAPLGHVLEAEDGMVGLELAREALPDLIVADVMMPRMDGLEMSRALHQDARTDAIPLLFLTARAAAKHQIEGLDTGADDYVTKPFTAEVLRARAGGLIARRERLRRRLREEFTRQFATRMDPEQAFATSPEPIHSAEDVSAPGSDQEPASDSIPPDETETVSATQESPAPAAPRQSHLLERARVVIQAHLLDEEFQVNELADALALSRSQLHRRLKAEADLTPSQLLMEVRLDRAAELLRRKEGNVTEVAFAVGFKSLSHFHRSFRQRFEIAPSELLRSSS